MGWCRWWFLFAGSKFVGSPCIYQFLQILRTEVSPSNQLTTWSCPGSFCSSKPDQHVVLVSVQSNGKTHVLWNQIKSNQIKSNQIKSNQIKYPAVKLIFFLSINRNVTVNSGSFQAPGRPLISCTELGTLKWWILRSMLDPLFLLISRLT